jgi:hypothetical protein
MYVNSYEFPIIVDFDEEFAVTMNLGALSNLL